MAANRSPRAVGRIAVNPRGFGFFTVEEGPEAGSSSFVAPPDLNPFLDGDLVRATVRPSGDGRTSAHDLELVERERKSLFGTVVHHRGRPHLQVDRQVANTDWPLAPGHPELRDGTLVVAEIGDGEARFERRVEPTEAGLERVLARWGIRHQTPPACRKAAREARARDRPRRDLRELPTVTIDAEVTRDLDDALAVLPAQSDGAVRVLISIADVDAYAPRGSELDAEARRRATSVYLPDRVIPMFPEELSERGASLVEGEERPALTVELRIDPEGRVTAVDLYESLIRSHARLTYEAVAAFLDEGRRDAVPAPVREPLRWLRTAAARLSSVRTARGGLSFVREEARLTLHAESLEPTGVVTHVDSVSHRLVERLMVAANEAVGQWLVDRGLPGIFRVHDAPAPEKVESLAQLARNFGFEAGFGGRFTPRVLAAFEAQFQSAKVAPSIETVLREVLGPARYSARPGSHFGLAAPIYTHFTSPIRRYTDLVVHRVVKAHLHGRRDQEAGDPELAPLVEHVNERAYEAAKAEAERLYMLTARLFKRHVGERFRGNVVAVKPFGLVVQLEGPRVTGTLAAEALPGGPYRLDAASQSFASRSRRFVVGQSLEVKVAATDEELGRIELDLVDSG